MSVTAPESVMTKKSTQCNANTLQWAPGYHAPPALRWIKQRQHCCTRSTLISWNAWRRHCTLLISCLETQYPTIHDEVAMATIQAVRLSRWTLVSHFGNCRFKCALVWSTVTAVVVSRTEVPAALVNSSKEQCLQHTLPSLYSAYRELPRLAAVILATGKGLSR